MVYDVSKGRLFLIGTIPDPLQDAVVTSKGLRCCCCCHCHCCCCHCHCCCCPPPLSICPLTLLIVRVMVRCAQLQLRSLVDFLACTLKQQAQLSSVASPPIQL